MQCSVLNQPIVPNKLNYDAKLDDTTCIHSIFQHFEILEWFELAHNFHRESFEFVLN